ncbi:TKL protein kinase [Saprolegnia diclina VS20]|uniref:TKL protein kinase n=1 Tax=Saprolegnia diclina (strain VS20) TaxID=1156394 RepID=T0PN72_SAPDV|nr:TKL protein kinase [Saprolegnia diclina VS20]EQC26864.1 TKL protein kinase [Saprolegnia diclina VS20]|eukprot:XP_008619766.1 TKL protein kinase [Saprolegnia diclina VS20]
MDVTIMCQVCNHPNDMLTPVCVSDNCGDALPGYDKKIKILLRRLEQFNKALAAGGGVADNSDATSLVADLRRKLEATQQRATELKHELETLKEALADASAHRRGTLAHVGSSSDMDAERKRLAEERKEIDMMRRLFTSLQTIPYIDLSQFRFQKALPGGGNFDLQVGLFDGKRTVLKKLVRNGLGDDVIEHFKSSISLMAKLDGGGGTVVTLYGASGLGQASPMMYMEHMERGDLRTFLHTTSPSAVSWKTRLEIALNVSKAIAKMHSLDLIHRDLSSYHVLLNERNVAKVTGFSSAREKDLEQMMTNGVGDFRWAAPETMNGSGNYSETVDIYALGLLLIELDTHAVPYSSYKDKQGRSLGDFMLMEIIRKAVPGQTTITHAFASAPLWYQDLALRCVSLDPNARPSAVDVVAELQKQLREGSYDNVRSIRRLQKPPPVLNAKISVVRAKNLLDTQAFGVQDPYCRLSLGGRLAKTKVHDNGGCDPKWSQTFPFNNVHPIDMILEINIMNKNLLFDGQIGKVTVPLEETLEKIDAENVYVGWSPVYSRGEMKGHVLLRFEYEGSVASWLEAYAAEMSLFHGVEGHVRDIRQDEVVMKKVTEIFLPRLKDIASAVANVAGKAA